MLGLLCSHNDIRHDSKMNHFWACKHGHVVAAVMSRAQLWIEV